MKIGFIGSGNISRFHIDALKNNNFSIEAIGTRNDSKNCFNIAKDFNLLNKYCSKGWKEVLEKKVDAFCLCIDIAETPDILLEILDIGLPVLVEKPVAWQIKNLDNILNHPNKDKIFVGYNRRFYRTLNILREKCDSSVEGGTILVNIPDPVLGVKQFLSNGCHMIDSLRYLVGDFEIKDKLMKFDKNKNDILSITALCKSEKFDILLNAHSLIPSNFSITINNSDFVYELKPLEKLTFFNGMEVIEPTTEEPIRRYIPRIESSIVESSLFKPGFNEMYSSFNRFVSGNAIEQFCSIDDAKKTLQKCWDLIGSEMDLNLKN